MLDRQRGWARIGAIILLTLALIYVGKLASLVMARQRALAVERDLQHQVAARETEVALLEAAATAAGSDAYVERWAREERLWVLEGDQPVAPIAATPTPAAGSGGPGTGDGFWERLKRWLGAGP
jgi:hypothetical protein